MRTATTFGPSFAERALTSGEGNVSVGVNFMSATYDRLGDAPLRRDCQLRSVTAASPADGRSGIANLDTDREHRSSSSGRMGVTDKLDIGVAVPIVTVKVDGTSSLANGNGDMILFASGNGVASGLGDIAGHVKYRFYSFGSRPARSRGVGGDGHDAPPDRRYGEPPRSGCHPDAGLVHRLQRTRTIPAARQRRVRVVEQRVSASRRTTHRTATVTARHQFEYAAGLEFEAAPKVTLLVDLLGRTDIRRRQTGCRGGPSPRPGVTSSASWSRCRKAFRS